VNLAGRTALVTGASSGIGAATSIALAEAGAHVVLTARNKDRLAATAAGIATASTTLAADLLDPAGLATVRAAAQRVDLLVHCAGRGWAGRFAAMPSHDIDTITRLNLAVPLQLTRAALPAMLERDRGHLVFVSSVAMIGVKNEAAYSASKAALRSFAAALRHEVDPSAIGITTVMPGAVNTPFFLLRGQPYHRRFPKMVDASQAAHAIVRAIQIAQSEVFIPRWLTIPARLSGALPAPFHRLANRFT
jgi:hypothetical protein